jgi:hypothetical protein
MGEVRNECKIIVGKPAEKRPRRRWDGNIKVDVREIGCEDLDLINLAVDRIR